MMTVWSKSSLFELSNATPSTEVKVSGIVQEVLSSERRRLASAFVKTVGEEKNWPILERGRRERKDAL